LQLVARDSHSGTQLGSDQLLELLYTDEVQYLIGPEETELGNEIVADIKGLNIFNMLPGYATPNIKRNSSKGAWMRLGPTTSQVGCGMSKFAFEQGVETINTLGSQEDYNLSLSTEVGSQFLLRGGTSLPSVTVDPEASTYKKQLEDTFRQKADRTVLIAYPATASALVTEWAVTGKRGQWFLSPLLRAEAFLLNVPFGSLDGTYGLSPSLSLASECEAPDPERGNVNCTHGNSERFAEHFADRWDGDRPLSASRLYYDAVVLIALGMRYGLAVDGELPTASRLHQLIRELNTKGNGFGSWADLKKAMAAMDDGKLLRFRGAGAEYSFDNYGAAEHVVYDVWKVKAQRFVDAGSFFAQCRTRL
jgi:neutral amino acid transport system substrate-binding protein